MVAVGCLTRGGFTVGMRCLSSAAVPLWLASQSAAPHQEPGECANRYELLGEKVRTMLSITAGWRVASLCAVASRGPWLRLLGARGPGFEPGTEFKHVELLTVGWFAVRAG